MRPIKSKTRLLVINLAVLAATLVMCEAALRVICHFSPSLENTLNTRGMVSVKRALDDGSPNPEFFEHDGWGFRNRSVPESADIVVFGDSQTYGAGAPPESVWPRRLGVMTGREVYNLAFSGWGQVDYLDAWDKAAELHPKLVIAAVYTGNDFFDCYVRARKKPLYGLASEGPETKAAIAAAEKANPLQLKVSRAFKRTKDGSIAGGKASGPGGWRGLARDAYSFLKAYRKLRLTALIETVVNKARHAGGGEKASYVIDDTDDMSWYKTKMKMSYEPDYVIVVDSDRVRTCLEPVYRHIAVDCDDPRISEGIDISVEVLKRLNEDAAGIGAGFAVLIIPTKESVIWPYYTGTGGPLDGTYRDLVDKEAVAVGRLKKSLEAEGITCIEAGPSLSASVEAGESPYPQTTDGHPNSLGHEVIASCVAGRINEMGLVGR